MKKTAAFLTFAGLLVLALSLTAHAEAPIQPTVTAVEPSSAYNDIDTPMTITGIHFATDAAAIPTVPIVTLGGTPLTDVTWIDTQTLTATVPWGMDAGTYDLGVTNPGGLTSTLTAAFQVTSGIGSWNSGDLFGGSVSGLTLKPGDPAAPGDPYTIYAETSVGLFRSTDAADSWQHVDGFTDLNAHPVLDPSPAHSGWLYYYSGGRYDGLWRSKDRGATWTRLADAWSGNGADRGIFISPFSSKVIYQSAYPSGDLSTPHTYGLKRSTDGGASWSPTITTLRIQSIAFDPTSDQNLVAATSDGKVYRSTNGGTVWAQAATPDPTVTDIFDRGFVTYNPFVPGEVWFSANANSAPHGLYRSNDTSLTAWTKLDQDPVRTGVASLTFAAPGVVYTPIAVSTDDGNTWGPYGPSQSYGALSLVFAPDTTQTAFASSPDVGIRTTTNGGVDWPAANQGLRGLLCTSMDVSRADPLRVYTAFDGPLGIYRSTDGTNHWTFFPITIPGFLSVWNVRQVLEDPFDPTHVWALTGVGLCESTDTCASWRFVSSPVLSVPFDGQLDMVAADPSVPGHLLGSYLAYDTDNTGHSWLIQSSDGGTTWSDPVPTLSDVLSITGLVFDPETTGTVYATTRFSGLWRSIDSGDTWVRIDDRSQPYMAELTGIAIAAHPQHVLMVQTPQHDSYRSTDDGRSWHVTQGIGEDNADACMFVENDSGRLYAATSFGLYFSRDLGETWTRATGYMGTVEITSINWAVQDGRAIIYTATTGLKNAAPAPATSTTAAMARSLAVGVAAVSGPSSGAGIYRRAQIETTITASSSATRDGWVLESSHTSSHGGTSNSTASTFRLGDDSSKKQYRGVLSFATNSLPDSAVITKVMLRVRRQGVSGGGDPVAKFQGFMADVKNGYFGSSTSLQTGDFQASASKSVGAFKPLLTGGWYEIDLTGAKAYVNKTASRSGLTQVRLRFKLDDNNNRKAEFLSLYSGNASAASRPQLVVTYYVP